jgi:2'-5' RNA ligase
VTPVPKARLGVALLLPGRVAAEVDGLRRALGDGALGRIPPHLTLVPPVNVHQDRMADALAVLRDAAARSRPLRLTLGPPATFHPVNPVVYLTVGGDLDAVHDLRDSVFRDPLARALTWPFVPHVTLADGIDPDRIPPSLYALGDYRTEVVVDRVHVLEEQEGRRWEPIADAALALPAVVGRGGLALELSVTEGLDAEAAEFERDQWGDDGRTSLALTGRRTGRIVGTAVGWVEPASGVGYLSRLVVERGARGEGIGSHLLAAFASAAVERGAEVVRLRTEAGGEAERFYRERGWVEELRLPAHRRGRDYVQLHRRTAPG